jgi:hypothetical protein
MILTKKYSTGPDPEPDPIPKQENAPPGGCPDSPIDIDNVEM